MGDMIVRSILWMLLFRLLLVFVFVLGLAPLALMWLGGITYLIALSFTGVVIGLCALFGILLFTTF